MVLRASHPLLSYFKLRHTQAIFACFLAASLLLVAFPGIDLAVSRLFFDDGFYMANQKWTRLLHGSVPWFVVASIGAVTAIYVFNRLAARNICGIDGRKVVYLLLVLALGAGLIVNGILKAEFGRARPRDITEFGGATHFTPAYVVSSNCSRNCSFSSGDTAGAFFSLACVAALSRRRSIVTAAVGFGVFVSAARIASGSHFLSDAIVSFFVMLIVSDALYYRIFLFSPQLAEPAVSPALSPASVLLGVAEKPAAPL
jgi:lipid A 4'-phosphatase